MLASQLDPNAVVVDLGADHRLEEKSAWDAFYGGDFYQHWTYGMPELITGVAADGSYSRQREALPGTKRIAGPGCNVTATTLALQPGIAQGLVEPKDIVADLVVGYSGAGKNLKRTNLLAAEAFGQSAAAGIGSVRTATFRRSCRTSRTRPARVLRRQTITPSPSRRFSRRWRAAFSPPFPPNSPTKRLA